MKTDKELHRDVVAELSCKPSLRNQEIGVAVKDGCVTLSGEVCDYLTKYKAEHAAETIRGVKQVAVELQVRLPASLTRTGTPARG